MKGLTGAILIAAMLFAGPAFAQYYKYLNKQGDVRFTDDINQVPREQRDTARTYPESQPSEKPVAQESAAVTEEKPAGHGAPAAPAVAGAEGEDPVEGARLRLEAFKKEIEAEYQSLVKEQDRLAKEKAAQKTREQINAYNKGVEAFNQRAEIFDKSNNELRKLVEDYNALVDEANSKTAAAPKK